MCGYGSIAVYSSGLCKNGFKFLINFTGSAMILLFYYIYQFYWQPLVAR